MPFASAPTAERNIITVLAVDMVGSTRHIAACDPDDAQAFLDHWLAHIRNAVEHAGGVIVHYAGDGGIAIFGWPSAFEDHICDVVAKNRSCPIGRLRWNRLGGNFAKFIGPNGFRADYEPLSGD